MQVDNYKEAQLYTGNGITTQFDFYFSFGATAEIKVFVAGEELASNQYSVSSANYQSGGTVICLVAPILNAAIRIERQTPFTQESAFSNFNQVDLKKLETSLDKMVRIEQELRNAIDTSAESNFQNQIDAISDVLTEVSEFTQDIDDDLQEHKENTENPHSVTKTQVGLENVDNTSDVNKPVSSATSAALGLKVDKVAGKELSTNDLSNALKGNYDTAYSHSQTTGNPHGTTKTDVGLGNADNTSDASKPVSTATQTALNEKVSSTLTREPTGFLDPANVIVTYNSTTRKITLTGTTTAYYCGALVTSLVSGWESPTAHDDTVGTYFLYYNGTSFVWGTSFTDFSVLQIAIINYRATNSFGNRECHGFMPWQCHQEDHMTVGTYRSSGGDISNVVPLSTTADNRRPIISACTIWDEDCPTINAELTSKKYSQRFISSASDINYTLQANDIVPLSGSNPYYNSFTTPNYGQTLMPDNSVMTVWLYEIPTSADSASQEIRHVFVQGQSITQATNSSAGSLTTAYNAELIKQPSDLNLGVPAIVAAEYIAIHKFILQYTGGNWTIRGSIKLTGTRSNQTGSPSGTYLSAVSHDDTLSGDGTPSAPLGVVQTDLVHKTGDETIAGIKTFSSSPIVPTPTTNTQVANKGYVDANIGGSSILPSGTCSTAGATAAKEVTVAGYTEATGKNALITFANKNYALGPNLYIPFTGGTAADPLGVYTLTTIGSPTYTGDKFNSNGNSGLSYNITSLGSGAWCLQQIFRSTNTTTPQTIFNSDQAPRIGMNKDSDNKIHLYLSGNGSSWDIANGVSGYKADWATNTDYYIRLRFTGTHYYVDWSTDGTNWTNDIDITSSASIYASMTGLRFGINATNTNPLIGTMDDLYVSIGSATTIKDYPTMNINGGGAKSILHADGTRVTPANPAYFIANCPIQFCYDGTGYRFKQEVVKTYVNGTTWYNLSNNGWVEQGCHSVNAGSTWTLPIPMANDTYTLVASYVDTSSTNTPQWQYMGIKQYSTYITTTANGIGQRIYICGMAT